MGNTARRMRQDAAARAIPQPDIKVYRCDGCEHRAVITAPPRVEVPDEVGCLAGTGCTGRARLVDTGRRDWPPVWEWYLPDGPMLARLKHDGGPLWEHAQRGGLLVRRHHKAPV